jgi:membrane-bound lytic murein transglycosylase D
MKFPSNYLSFFVALLTLASCSQSNDSKHVKPNQEVISNAFFVVPKIPNSMELCGETIDLTDMDVRDRLDREILANAYFHSSTMLYLKRANRFFPAIEKLLKEKNMPLDLKYLSVIESGLSHATSPAGARGFWQFMPGTAKEFDLEVNDYVDERLNLEKSTMAACNYLSLAKDSLKDWFLAIASYNRGVGGVRSDMKWQESSDYFDTHMNNETGRYIFRMMAIKLIMENPREYGYDLSKMELYEPYQTETIQVSGGIKDVSKWAINKGVNYKIIKILNPWILNNSLPGNRTFDILLPNIKMNLKPRRAYS